MTILGSLESCEKRGTGGNLQLKGLPYKSIHLYLPVLCRAMGIWREYLRMGHQLTAEHKIHANIHTYRHLAITVHLSVFLYSGENPEKIP